MQTKSHTRAPVKYYRLKKTGFLDPRTARLVRSCARIRGYCIGALANGATWFRWNKHAFAKRTGLQVHYVEEVMRTFRKTSTEFDITEHRWRRSPRLKVSYRGACKPMTETEIRARLIGYIRGALRMNAGRPVKVDAWFLNHFIATTGLPREVVLAVADGLKFIAGCELRWRGLGGNFKFVVSLQGLAPPYGSPTGRRYRNTVAPAAPGVPSKSSNAVPAIDPDQRASRRCPPNAGAPPFPSPPALRVSPGNPSGAPSRCPQPGLAPPGAPRADTLAKQLGRVELQGTLADPIHIGDRWISGQKILRLACWMALEPMRAVHLRADQVLWRFAHARNFAARAMRLGHRKEFVIEAYTEGVEAAHEDALDAGLRGTERSGGHVRESGPREPSAAVAYAWQILRRDARSPAERWRDIFAEPRRAPLPRAKLSAAARARTAPRPAAPKTARAAERAEKFRGLKKIHDAFAVTRPLADTPAASQITAAELLAHLQTRDMTLADFNALPWASKKRVVQVVLAKRTAPQESTK